MFFNVFKELNNETVEHDLNQIDAFKTCNIKNTKKGMMRKLMEDDI